jgi:predicted adenylyl cyclase CyaB
MRNLEIKARVTSLAAVRRRLRAFAGATRSAILRQTDWYFRVPRGRLKLRQVASRRDAEVVAYLRPDRASARTSEFQRLPVSDAAGTRRLLEHMLGLGACVRKRREVWLYRNARIHFDTVERLGQFIEVEVVVTEGMPQARALMKELCEALRIGRRDLLARSYGEMSGVHRQLKARKP